MNTGTRRTAGSLGHLNRKLLKTIPKDPRVEHTPCPKLTRPRHRIIVENQCIIVESQHQPPSPHLAQTPVDGAFRIAFASPHKRLWRLAFWHLSTSCNFFVTGGPAGTGQGAEKAKRPKATGNGSSPNPITARNQPRIGGGSFAWLSLTWPGPKAALPKPQGASAAPRSLHAP